MKTSMFYGASNIIFQNAHQLRKNQTDAEKLLWNQLKLKPFGCKFRRQHPLGLFIADFYCHKAKLVIEIDGSIHLKEDVIVRDRERQKMIEEDGLSVLRFTNQQVYKNIAQVLITIEEFLLSNNLKESSL